VERQTSNKLTLLEQQQDSLLSQKERLSVALLPSAGSTRLALILTESVMASDEVEAIVNRGRTFLEPSALVQRTRIPTPLPHHAILLQYSDFQRLKSPTGTSCRAGAVAKCT
jgi:hypothetical protein